MNSKLIMAGFAMTLGISALVAQPTLIDKVEAQEGKLVIPYERWKLPNGLTILLHEDHSDPVVNVQVTYKVGSNRESLGKSGFAHFFEHMMFQGSKNVADEEHFKLVSNAGGNMNGYTTSDETVYFETVPSNYLEMALYLESDRMGFLLDSLTSKKFENQRDAVKNEKSQNVENVPYAMAYVEEMPKALYPPGHPYSWPVIGYVDDLDRANLEDVKNFFLRWYGPNNAILAISGDFNKEEALKLIDKYFAELKPCPEVKKMRVPPVVIASDKYTAYKDRTYLPLNLRVYPTIPLYHRDEPALDLLSIMLGDGNNSLLYKNFVKSKDALQANAYHQVRDLGGEFTIQIFAYPPEDFNLEKLFTDLDNRVKSTIEQFGKEEITDENLTRAKGQMEGQFYGYLNSVASKNSIISNWERLLGRGMTLEEELERYRRVTAEDISRVYNKYIKSSGAAILNTYPIMDKKDSVKSVNPYAGREFPENPEYKGLTYTPIQSKLDRTKRPDSGPAHVVRVPDFFKKQLPNGLTVSGTRDMESPQVTLVLTIEGGYLAMDKSAMKKMGVVELSTLMLDESTQNYTTEQISAELQKLGTTISFSPGRTATSVFMTCHQRNLDRSLQLFEERLLKPAFNEEDFKRVKKQYKESLRDEQQQPQAIAQKAFNQTLYGDNILGLFPTTKSVDGIDLADVKEYYSRAFSPVGANLVIVGNIDESEITGKLKFLEGWAKKDVELLAVPEDVPAKEPRFFIVDKERAPSSIVVMGYPSLKFDATGDYFRNRVANFIFGGNFNSRLNLNLREDKGYTYGIRSNFTGGKYSGVFQISASVKRAATAASIAEILKEFRKYETGGITDSELEFTKNSMLNVEALQYEAPMQKASFISTIARFNLERDYTAKQADLLRRMTKEDVNQQIKKYFDSNKLTAVVVGDRWIIESQLERLSKDAANKEALNKVKLKKLSID